MPETERQNKISTNFKRLNNLLTEQKGEEKQKLLKLSHSTTSPSPALLDNSDQMAIRNKLSAPQNVTNFNF
jgi:hypothetical protein